ncbi:MAG TPA: RecX family transcriptional regulator [Ktedonobacteraceae bacterium]|nr:RecX family transcriptional regulator [Ktedonobacteraceae bacterium]
MRITALQPQTNNQDRINVFVDDQFLLGVSALIVLQMGLRVGQELSPDQLEQLNEEEALQQATNRVLNFLSFRPRSREEVRRYLRKKETPPELIDAVMQRLDDLDLINDQSFTEFWIESRERSNPKGAQALKNELRMKGVKRELVDELVTDEQDEERALRAGRKKAAQLTRQSDMDFKTFRARLGPFLQRRGFSYQVSTHAVHALWKEVYDEEPED